MRAFNGRCARLFPLPSNAIKLFGFRLAQLHNILLYRNLSRSHDRLRRQEWLQKRITESFRNG